MKGKRVLIVDDEPEICEIISFELEEEGLEIATASSGNMGLKIISQEPPFDIILSDVRMADGSGVDLLKGLKEKQGQMPPVILITGFSDVSEEEVLRLGAHAIISKPISFAKLKDLIIEALSKQD